MFCAELDHRQAKVWEGAEIYIIDHRMPTQLLDGSDVLCATGSGKLPTFVFGPIGARYDPEADAPVGERVLLRDSACSDDANAQLRPPQS